MNGEEYDLRPETQTAFTDTRFNLNNIEMGDESVFTFDKILERLDYNPAKGSNLKRTKSIKKSLKTRVDECLDPTSALPVVENEETSVELQAERMKIIIPANIIDFWTGLEVL